MKSAADAGDSFATLVLFGDRVDVADQIDIDLLAPQSGYEVWQAAFAAVGAEEDRPFKRFGQQRRDRSGAAVDRAARAGCSVASPIVELRPGADGADMPLFQELRVGQDHFGASDVGVTL